MSLRSSVLAGAAALLLVLVLGNPFAVETVVDDSPSWLGITAPRLVGSFSLGLGDRGFETGPSFLRAVVIVLVAFVLGGMAGRARPLAALVGGWGAAFGAFALGAIAFELTVDEVYRSSGSSELVDRLSTGAAAGGFAAFWVGWVVALAVLLGRDRRVVRLPREAAGPAPVVPYGQYAQPGPYGQGAPYGQPSGATPAPSAPPATPAPGAPTPTPAPAPPAPAPAPSATPTPPPAPPSTPAGGPLIGPPPDRSGASRPDDDPTVIT